MKTSLYLSGNLCKVVEGTGSKSGLAVSRCFTFRLSSPLLASSEDEARICAKELSDFFDAQKLSKTEVHLVLNDPAVRTRPIELPAVSKRQLLGLVQNEFAAQQIEGNEDLLYDCMVLAAPKGALATVLGAAVPRTAVAKLVSAFEAAGISLSGIDLALPCALRFIANSPAFAQKTFILSILEGSEILSVLFENKVYRFANSAHIFEQRGTPVSAVEIARNISSMIQFNQAQKLVSGIQSAYLCGLQSLEKDFCENMSISLNLEVAEFPEELSTVTGAKIPSLCGEYLYALGGLFEE